METMAMTASPPPQGTASPPLREQRVRGSVELVTEQPIVLPRQDGPRARLDDLLDRHRWLVPAMLLGIIAILLTRERPQLG